ncbi:hypothetical protein MATR_18000 [Marivirga tractuosa]|uniref:fibronectin type III domain-containing protein n=1 Tax=Marivirga tractuosa TaxID=1006 RepID=UPI002B305F1B|nr:hypothetical protein MATR_18000 [Marivirga tractuosa]
MCLLSITITLLLSVSAQAQNASNPVQVTSNLMTPYSLYLSDYSDASQKKWNIQLLLKDFTKTDYQAKLRITIEGAGIRLRTRQGFSPGPIRLNPGIPYQVDATDLTQYLRIQNMEVSGINRNKLASTQKLPEGFYHFKIEVLDYNRNNRVSNIGTSIAWLVLNDPPLLNLPFQEKIRIQDPQQVQFQWTPRHTSSPNSAFETEYIFKLWEIWPEGRDANEVARTTRPLFERRIMTTSYFYGLNDAMLIPGRSYAWQVQAVNLNGRDLFKNQGKSEVRWFKYGDECLPITNLGAEALGTDRIRITWEGGWNHNRYVAQIREKGEEKWINYGTNIETKVVYDLQVNTEYQIRVLPSCGALEGTTENTLTLSTPEQDVQDLDCGAESDLPLIENREPIAELNAGDQITAAGFTVILTEVIKTGETYTGMGLIEVPLFNSARVEAVLNDIKVNTDKQLIGGNVESTLNPNGPFILDTDEVIEELSEEGTGEQTENADNSFEELPDTDIDIEGEIADVEYDEEEGTITVTDTEGNTTEIDPETADENQDGETVLEDEEGNVYVVDEDGELSGPYNPDGDVGEGENAQDSQNVQEELIREVLVFYKQQINAWIENYEKGPLDKVIIKQMSDFPDCLPDDVDELQDVLEKIKYYESNKDELISLIEENESIIDRFEFLVDKLNGEQPPYVEGLTDNEWSELLGMVCPYLLPEIDIEGLSEDLEFVAFESLPNSYQLKENRYNFTYTILDTLSLSYNKFEIFQLTEDDTVLVNNYSDLDTGKENSFIDTQDQDSIGWSGKDINGDYIKAGDYLVNIVASIDSSYSNGFQDSSEIRIFPFDMSITDDVEFEGFDSSDPAGCFRRAADMLENAGYETVAPNHEDIVQMTRNNEDDILEIQDNIVDGIHLINEYLDDDIPIMDGVDYRAGHPGNLDETTDHWLVIVGRTTTNNQTCYRYYDAQTAHETIGTSSENQLCEQDDYTLTDTYREGSVYERTYTVTMVRPSEEIND